jgi:UDP-sulfoquinovose synthase
VHLGECPSAPFSMIDAPHAALVQHNNIINTMNVLYAMHECVPEAHLIKLGTMGEYGTPDIDIPEGFFDIEYRGRKARLPFPRNAGSWYHWSKVHGSNNIMFASRLWGLKASDIMQGVIFGTRIDETKDDDRFVTRLDFDESFGTLINRFCCQAVIGHPLTLYGAGKQKRGFMPLPDSVACMTLIAENPPLRGTYRVFNQFDTVYSIGDLAKIVQQTGHEFGLDVAIRHYDNPRTIEMEDHYYNPDRQNLLDLGYKPQRAVRDEVRTMLADLSRQRARIEAVKDVLIPRIRWNENHRKSHIL